MKFTVILRRPDYIADDWPDDCYLAHVDEPTPEMALHAARTEVRKADGNRARGNDYSALFMFEGHHKTLVWPWSGA